MSFHDLNGPVILPCKIERYVRTWYLEVHTYTRGEMIGCDGRHCEVNPFFYRVPRGTYIHTWRDARRDSEVNPFFYRLVLFFTRENRSAVGPTFFLVIENQPCIFFYKAILQGELQDF